MVSELFVDANVLIRLVTNRPTHLADRAALLLGAAENHRSRVILPPLILAEVVYVLKSVYNWSPTEIAGQLLDLVTADIVIVLEREIVIQALLWYRDISGLSFADAYLASTTSKRNSAVLSLDRGMDRVPGIRLIEHPDQLSD